MLFGAAGCNTPSREVPAQATDRLMTLRDQLVKGKANVQTTSNAANDLITNTRQDILPQVDRLARELTNLRGTASAGRAQFESAEAEASAFFSDWQNQMASMPDSFASAGDARRRQAQASFERLSADVQALRVEFQPFMKSLTAAEQYLRTDTTPAGVRAMAPEIRAAVGREAAITRRIDRLIEGVDAIRAGR